MNTEDYLLIGSIIAAVFLIIVLIMASGISERSKVQAVENCVNHIQKPLECKAAYGL